MFTITWSSTVPPSRVQVATQRWLILVGLVGLTIIGTIPTLLPTTAYNRAVSGREAMIAWRISLVGIAAIGFSVRIPEAVGVGTVLVSAAGIPILRGILVRLWGRGRHKLTFLQITVGMVWLLGWGLIDGARVMVDGSMSGFSTLISGILPGSEIAPSPGFEPGTPGLGNRCSIP